MRKTILELVCLFGLILPGMVVELTRDSAWIDHAWLYLALLVLLFAYEFMVGTSLLPVRTPPTQKAGDAANPIVLPSSDTISRQRRIEIVGERMAYLIEHGTRPVIFRPRSTSTSAGTSWPIPPHMEREPDLFDFFPHRTKG